MYVTVNAFGYQYWELMDVVDHLMIVPKRHVLALGQLTEKEKQQFMDLIVRYEAKGYNMYAREGGSAMKSVPHQHTHLIKTNNRVAKLAVYIKKPYLLIKK